MQDSRFALLTAAISNILGTRPGRVCDGLLSNVVLQVYITVVSILSWSYSSTRSPGNHDVLVSHANTYPTADSRSVHQANLRVSTPCAKFHPVTTCAAAGTPYQDRDTGFTFSSYDIAYKLEKHMTYRIAVPASVPERTPYDVVVQIVAPTEVGWAGLAWAGTMISCPLTVAWKNGNTAIVSGRWATYIHLLTHLYPALLFQQCLRIEWLISSRSYSPPSIDSRASFEILPKGTRVNTTHWQYTAKCTGCTSFVGRSSVNSTLNVRGSNRIAYAWSSIRPSSSSPSSSINVHDGSPTAWNHDFSLGANANWATLLMQNLGHS